MLCESCGKNLRKGAIFCGKCGAAIPIKCVACGIVQEDDDVFCYKCGKKFPETPVVGDEDAEASPTSAASAVKKPAAKTEVKPASTAPVETPPIPEPPSWRLTSGKDLLEFYDLFAHKVGFVLEEEVPIDGTDFVLKAHRSIILIWDSKQNGIKLEGFYKDSKRVSFWVNIQKGGANDAQNQVGGKDEVVLGELDSIFTYMEYYNKSLIKAIEIIHAKYC